MKVDHSKLFHIGQQPPTVSWTSIFTCLTNKFLPKEVNHIQLFISYQDLEALMIMLLKNLDLPDMLTNTELLLFSQIQVQETQVSLVFLKIGKLETVQVTMLMQPMIKPNNFSKCFLTLTNNFQKSFQHISQSAEQTFQSQVSAWEVMELWFQLWKQDNSSQYQHLHQ